MAKIDRFAISKITHKESFYEVSRDLGVSEENIEKSFELAVLWEKLGYVEVYEELTDRQYGRVKKSWIKDNGDIVSAYKGLYHGRVSRQDDPLLIVALPWDLDTSPRKRIVEMQFVINHDDIFGKKSCFAQPKNGLKNIYIRISEFRNKS
jgi:hypothetical protein